VRAVPCSVRSRQREEPLQATASIVRRWLVVEQPGPWGRDALLQSRLSADVGLALSRRARAAGVRVLLSRRPGWAGSPGPRRVHLASTRSDGGWVEHLDVTDDAELLRLDLGALDARRPPGLGRPGPHPLLLVCTHGRHDACCANEGRPVVRALADAGVPDVWESSHVGGDRFAANLVALPSGVYLGRVPAERAPQVARDLAAGLVDLATYRGRSCHPLLVQAADTAVRQATGERRVHGIRVEAVETLDPDRARVTVAVEAAAPGRYEVVVSRRRGPSEVLTCTGSSGQPWTYEVEHLTPR
jgi:hypothetical protein